MRYESFTDLSRAIHVNERFGAAILCALLSIAVMPASRAADAPASANATSSAEMAEITVTATRREESLSKVPISVSAFSQETMDQKGVKDITDLVRFTPGISIDQTGTNAISIRGISSSGGAGTTGIYIDDTPISYTLPSTTFVQFRTGTTFGPWESSFFVDNLLNSHTTTNYERSAIDSGNPVYPPPGPQYNNYSFRPRTFGITVTFHQ